MDLIAQRGLPVRPQGAADETAAAGTESNKTRPATKDKRK